MLDAHLFGCACFSSLCGPFWPCRFVFQLMLNVMFGGKMDCLNWSDDHQFSCGKTRQLFRQCWLTSATSVISCCLDGSFSERSWWKYLLHSMLLFLSLTISPPRWGPFIHSMFGRFIVLRLPQSAITYTGRTCQGLREPCLALLIKESFSSCIRTLSPKSDDESTFMKWKCTVTKTSGPSKHLIP